jgi:hypothetical protein
VLDRDGCGAGRRRETAPLGVERRRPRGIVLSDDEMPAPAS